jgi:L-lactate dehydrogenase complex protein LldF
MPDEFHQKIHLALQDPQLQSALDGNAERRQSAFLGAFDSLPESRLDLRQRAHALRLQVIENLDRYLDQFVANAQANGITVHHADDGMQAVAIVRQIVQQSGARLVAKSKTMVGEEIHLNEQLESDGLRVVETDLGEFIIQLRGEPPAHIITPAVHLTRAQVARTFQEKLGLPYTTDIPELTAAARKVLRQTFLEAEIGISGVNFGVAETGGIVLVTNEGNGRMCTTLPSVHIALMGIERLVPTLDDLALMLNLLPRSATGQKLSVYTSLIHTPRQSGESDGPRQRHLILLDNGRRAMRFSPFSEALACIRCGACLNACPIFREIGGHAYVGSGGKTTPYPGPIGSVVSAGLFGVEDFGNLARASSLCGACKDACPVDIDLPKMLLRVRSSPSPFSQGESDFGQKSSRHTNVPLMMRYGLALYSFFARSPGRFRLVQRLGGFFTRLLPGRNGWMHLPAWTGWGYKRDFPRLATQPFSASKLARSLVPSNTPELDQSLLDRKAQVGHPVSAAPLAIAKPAKSSSTSSLVERFSSELRALGGEAVLCKPAELPSRILEAIQVRQAGSVQAWEDPYLPVGLIDYLKAGGITITHTADPSIRIGLTGALAGIAESGSLILTGGPGRSPSASLLPEIHLAVLRFRDLYERLSQPLDLPEVRQASSLVIITGPSRTADIEMTLTIGVHGPGELLVFITETD